MSQHDLLGAPVKADYSYAQRRCQGCGKGVIWGIDAEGTRIPLDPIPAVYTLSGFPAPNTTQQMPAVEVARAKRDEFMVSHFATCKAANKFSGSNTDDNPSSGAW